MSPLISEKQMAAISTLAETGMVTTVEIFRRSGAVPSASDDYGDNVEFNETSPSRRGTVQGWLRTVPASQASIDAGAVVTDTVWELRVPSGTDIQVGDDATIKTVEYTVVSTDADNTYLPYIKCNLRTRAG